MIESSTSFFLYQVSSDLHDIMKPTQQLLFRIQSQFISSPSVINCSGFSCNKLDLVNRARHSTGKNAHFWPHNIVQKYDLCRNKNLAFSTSSTANSNKIIPQYKVAKITEKGNVSFTNLSITEILKRVHARDLFSLALTSSQEYQSKRSSGRITGSTRSTIGNNTRRNKRSPTAILPRQFDIIVSFGSIRAVVGMREGWIFDAHKPSIQLLASNIGETFAIHYHQKVKDKERRKNNHSNNDNGALINSAGAVATTGDQHTNLSVDAVSQKDHYHSHFQRLSGLSSHKGRYEEGSETEAEYESFELIFLEEILRDVCATYNRRLKLYEPVVDTVVTRVSNEMHAASGVHRLVPIKDSLQEFELNIRSALDGITGLLGDDDDMLGLLLSENLEAQNRNERIQRNRHESVELLLEEYARQLSNILQETEYLLKKVQSKQELVAISLDAYRNRMLRMNLYLGIASVGLATSTAVAGFYGMNLINGYEDSPTAFANLVGLTSCAGLVFGIGCVSYMRGSASTARTMERLREIEVIDGSLNKMGALDYTMKCIADNKKTSMTKEEFRKKLCESQSFAVINDLEVDLLFSSLDVTNDGYLNKDDFSTLADLGRKASIESSLTNNNVRAGGDAGSKKIKP